MRGSYIRGAYAQASCALIDELKRQGIVAVVGYDSKKQDRKHKLIAYVSEENAFRVPREWRGFAVTVHIDNDVDSGPQPDLTSKESSDG